MLTRWPGTRSRILSGIQRAAQTVLGVYLKRTCSRVPSVSSALGVLTMMRYTYPRTHSLTHCGGIQKQRSVFSTDGDDADAARASLHRFNPRGVRIVEYSVRYDDQDVGDVRPLSHDKHLFTSHPVCHNVHIYIRTGAYIKPCSRLVNWTDLNKSHLLREQVKSPTCWMPNSTTRIGPEQSPRTCRRPGSPTKSGRVRLVEFGLNSLAFRCTRQHRRQLVRECCPWSFTPSVNWSCSYARYIDLFPTVWLQTPQIIM